jgi:hypothetical protein
VVPVRQLGIDQVTSAVSSATRVSASPRSSAAAYPATISRSRASGVGGDSRRIGHFQTLPRLALFLPRSQFLRTESGHGEGERSGEIRPHGGADEVGEWSVFHGVSKVWSAKESRG